MNRIFFTLTSAFVAFTVAACGGAPTSTGDVIPSANAPVVSPDTYLTSVADTDHILLDVRTDAEVAGGVIPGAIHIELAELPNRLSELPQDATIVVYCNSGNRSRSASSILANADYTNLLDLGGVVQWQRAGQSLVPLGS